MALRDIDLAYAAGFFDGEGCIQIIWKHGRKRNSSTLRVTIGNTDRAITFWLKKHFGGWGPYVVTPHATRFGTRPIWLWHASDRKAEAFLRGVLPYVRVKKEQVEIALEFRASVTRTGRKLPQEVILKRAYLADRLHCLKHPEVLSG